MNMEETGNDAVLLFDTLYTTNHIQMLKVLLPYIEAEQRNKIALLIKFQELQYTLHYTKNHTISLLASEEKKTINQTLLKCCPPFSLTVPKRSRKCSNSFLI